MGRIVARGPDEPHRCDPKGDRVSTYRLPAVPTAPAQASPVHTETYAMPGDVYQCECGLTWTARVRTVHHGWAQTSHQWRREGRWARWRRLTRTATMAE